MDPAKKNLLGTRSLAKMKIETVIDVDMFGKRRLTSYCKVLSPCIKQLRKVVFPQGKRWSREDKKLHSQMKTVLDEARKDLTSTR